VKKSAISHTHSDMASFRLPANGMLFKALGGFEKFQPMQMTFR
jgi:hypothetical protein